MGSAKKLGKVVTAPVRALDKVRTSGTVKKWGSAALGASGVGMLLQPEQMGIKNKKSQAMFTRGQRIGRIAVGATAAVLGGAGLAGMGPLAGSLGGIGTSLGGMLPTTAGGWMGAIGKGASLGKTALGMLGGGGAAGGGSGGGLAGLYGAYQGYKGQEGALDDVNRMESQYGGLLQRQQELAGLDPAVAAQMQNRARQGLRGAQAERGIYESGVSAAQEAELMPQIEQSQRAWQLQQLAGITPQYDLPMASAYKRAGMYGTGQEAGAALAGGGGGGGGGFDLAGLAGKAWDIGSKWFGGGGSPSYGEDAYSGIPSWMRGKG